MQIQQGSPRGVTSFHLLCCVALLCIVSVQAAYFSTSFGQVTPAVTPTTGSGNLGTVVTQAENVYQITGGMRPGNGPNLFHSFGEFGVPANNVANFLNDSGLATSNILGRVTGGHPSNIFGTIQTTGFGNANLFLMNPAGMVFGPNAALNVGGSVSFTTADYLRLADGATFNRIPGPRDAGLSSAPVAAFGFLGSNPAAITVQGAQLLVTPGQSLSLVGGDIAVQGAAVEEGMVQPVQLSAPGGQIKLASVASPGEILTGTLEQARNVNGQSFSALGRIEMSEQSMVDVSGNGGGAVVIRGGQFVLDNSTVSANVTGPGPVINGRESIGSGIDIVVSQDAVIQNAAVLQTNVLSNGTPGIQYGGVHLKADGIEVLGIPDFESFPFTGIRSMVAADSTGGNAGGIRLEASKIVMADLGAIQSITEAGGNAANIMAHATKGIEITGGSSIESTSGLFVSDTSPVNIPKASGNAGSIELVATSGNIVVSEGASIFSQTVSGTGSTGELNAAAPQGAIMLDGAAFFTQTRGAGGAGKIQLTAKTLEIKGSSAISDDNLGLVEPGGISISVRDKLAVEGGSNIATASLSPTGALAADLHVFAKDVVVTQNSSISSGTHRSGPGGQLTITTDTLQVTDGGKLRSGSTFFGQVQDPPMPTGPGGDVTIRGPGGHAGSVLIDGPGSGIFTETVGIGPGGSANISAQSVTIQNGGTISASTEGTAPSATGGNIAISAGQSVTLDDNGSITARSTGPANAGNISINAGSQFLSNNNSSVRTDAAQASGGNITVQAVDAIRLINSEINASVQGGRETAGGNILLDPAIVTLQNSRVVANAADGRGGNINIIAGAFFQDQSIVSATAERGISGTVNIQSPVSSLSGTLAILPQRPRPVHNLLSQRCAAQASGRLSSLVVAGRDSLPAEPGGWLISPMVLIPDENSPQPAQPVASLSAVPLRQTQVRAGRLSDHLGPLPQPGVPGWADGCGS